MIRRWLRGPVVLFLALASAMPARGDEIQIEQVRIDATEAGFVLDADFEFELNSRLEEALKIGLSLYFVVELEVSRGRWYLWDERLVQKSQSIRLWYHALTRQFRLSGGPLSQNFATLAETQRALARLRSWTIADRGTLLPGYTYICYLRMRLDNSQLPRPLQVSVQGNRDWSLASSWYRWTYLPAAEERAR